MDVGRFLWLALHDAGGVDSQVGTHVSCVVLRTPQFASTVDRWLRTSGALTMFPSMTLQMLIIALHQHCATVTFCRLDSGFAACYVYMRSATPTSCCRYFLGEYSAVEASYVAHDRGHWVLLAFGRAPLAMAYMSRARPLTPAMFGQCYI